MADISNLGDIAEEKKHRETPAEKGIFVIDEEEVVHSVPLVVIATMDIPWSQLAEGAIEPIRIPLKTEVFRLILNYHTACVCRNVQTIEESEKVRRRLELHFEQGEGGEGRMNVEEYRTAAANVGSMPFAAFLEYIEEMSDISSLLKIEAEARSNGFKRGAEYMHITTSIYTTLKPLTSADEEKIRTLRVGNVNWVGMCTQKEEADLSFSWMAEKKIEGPCQAQLDVQSMIDNENASPITDHLEEIL